MWLAPLRLTATALFLVTLDAAGDSELLEVQSQTHFDAIVASSERLFVEFSAEGCSICKGVEEELKKAAWRVHESGLKTKIARADFPEASNRFGFKGFPTWHYYVRGELKKSYTGYQQLLGSDEKIQAWVEKREVSTSNVKTQDRFSRMPQMRDTEIVLVARVKKKSAKQKSVWKAADELANYDAFNFRLVAQWLDKDEDPKLDARLTLYRPFWPADAFMPDNVTYDGKWSSDGIVSWVIQNAHPSVAVEFKHLWGPRELEETGVEASAITFLDKDADEEVRVNVEGLMRPFANEYTNWRFAVPRWNPAEQISDQYQALIDQLVEPAIFVLQKKRMYKLEGEGLIQDADEIRKFLNNIKAGHEKPSYKSEKKPARKHDDAGCLVLTGDTFESLVMDAKKDVVVLFTSPVKCPKCDSMQREWDKLGKRLGREGLACATMDGMLNECEEEMDALPKMVVYPAVPANKKMKRRQVYRGTPPDAEDMFDFVVENSKASRRDEI